MIIVQIEYFTAAAATAAKLLQSCLTLCDPIDGSPPGSPVPGILQARTLGWVAISFSNAGKWKVKVKLLSRVRLLATPWTAYQAPPSMGFSRQEYWREYFTRGYKMLIFLRIIPSAFISWNSLRRTFLQLLFGYPETWFIWESLDTSLFLFFIHFKLMLPSNFQK